MLAVPVLYQKINLAYGNRDPGLFQRLAKTGTGLTKFIQEIKIRYGQGIDDTTLQQLAKIFSTATQLRTLTWSGNYSIHDEILQNLHRSSPHARIIVEGEIPHRIEPSEPEQEQRIGVSSPNLYSLYATISAEPHAAQAAKLSVYHTLRSSPNIRKLEMYQQSGGCVRYGYQPELNVEFDVREGEQLPQLEELAFPMFSSRDMVRWGDMGGFSRLKVLKLSGYSTGIGAFVGRTPCLRSLTLDLPWEDIKASEQYLVQITGLEELVLSGYGMEFPFGLLEKNSDSLTALTVHAPEPCDPHRRPDVQLSVLQKLRETCPNLTFLAVDINREGEWVSLRSLFLSPLYLSHYLKPHKLTFPPPTAALRLPRRAVQVPPSHTPKAHGRRHARDRRTCAPAPRHRKWQIPVLLSPRAQDQSRITPQTPDHRARRHGILARWVTWPRGDGGGELPSDV